VLCFFWLHGNPFGLLEGEDHAVLSREGKCLEQREGEVCNRALSTASNLGFISATNRIHLVLFGMKNRTSGPYLAVNNRILISLCFKKSMCFEGACPWRASTLGSLGLSAAQERNGFLMPCCRTEALVKAGKVADVTIVDAQINYKKALEKGILKILSKMGISLLSCYHGAQVCAGVRVCCSVRGSRQNPYVRVSRCCSGPWRTGACVCGVQYDALYNLLVVRDPATMALQYGCVSVLNLRRLWWGVSYLLTSLF
jgi:Glutamate synthase central domain